MGTFVIVLSSIILVLVIIYLFLTIFVKKILKGRNDLLSRILVGLLTLQFLLGMLSNLFVTIPKDKSYVVYHEFGFILFHAINAFILLSFSIIFLVNSIKKKNYITQSITGFLAVFVAFSSGITYIATLNDIFSFTMSLGFITAFLIYTFRAFSSFGHNTQNHN